MQGLQKNAVVAQTLTVDARVDLKVNAAATQIESRFVSAGKFLRAELLQMKQSGIAGTSDVIQVTAERYIDALWLNCAKDYMQLGVFNYLEGARSEWVSGQVNKSVDATMKEYENLFSQLFVASAEQYARQWNAFRQNTADVIESEASESTVLLEKLEKTYETGGERLIDSAHRMKVQGTLDGIQQSGRTEYTYICNNADSTCDDCAALNGQIFDISNAEEGVNLPPIHPNCRCVVRGYPALPESETMADFLEAVAEVSIAAITDQASGKIRGIFDQLSEALGVVWSALFEQSILDYYGTFTTIEIDGVEYHINRNNFTAVAIGPDGKLIVPENAKPYDEQMLTLMKLRDSLPEGSAKRTEIE